MNSLKSARKILSTSVYIWGGGEGAYILKGIWAPKRVKTTLPFQSIGHPVNTHKLFLHEKAKTKGNASTTVLSVQSTQNNPTFTLRH